MFWKKDDKSKEIEELKQKLANLEESIKALQDRSNSLEQKTEFLGRDAEYIRAGTIKMIQALTEIIRTMKEQEVLSTPPGSQVQHARRRIQPRVQEEGVDQGAPQPAIESEQLESVIAGLLKDGMKMNAMEITRKVGRTREHVSRVLKSMTVQGKITRAKAGKVFVYSIASGS